MFHRILVPLDGSELAECVLPHVTAVARTYDAEVLLLRVLDPVNTDTRPRPIDPFDWQIRKAEAETYLEGIAARLQAAGLRTQTHLLEGRAAEMVVQFARNQDTNLIILSSHGKSGLSPWNVSSVVQLIILRARRSVMIVRAYQPPEEGEKELNYRRILLPLDGSPRAEAAIPVAEALASHHVGMILIAHVVRQPEMPRRTPLTQEDIQLMNQITERNRDEATRYLMELKSRLGGETETRLQISDRVNAELHELVDQENIDLVVLSAHGYSGETRWPYGSVVVSFIVYGTVPLLVVQDLPEDRIEPTPAELAAATLDVKGFVRR